MNRIKAVLWILTGYSFSVLNNVIVKYLENIPANEITSFRMLFSLLLLTPFVIKNPQLLQSKCPKIHFLRGIFFFIGITLWSLGVKNSLLATSSVIGLSEPFFVLIFSIIILNEKVGIQRFLAIFLCFLSILSMIDFSEFNINSSSFFLLLGTSFVAIYQILNKKCSDIDNKITSLIYYSFFGFLISCPFLFYNFVVPNFKELIILISLGLSADLLLFSLLKGYSLAEASFLSPLKYSEFVYSAIFGYMFFNEIPILKSLIVMLIIMCTNAILFLYEHYYKK